MRRLGHTWRSTSRLDAGRASGLSRFVRPHPLAPGDFPANLTRIAVIGRKP